jgi:hypothetical protein
MSSWCGCGRWAAIWLLAGVVCLGQAGAQTPAQPAGGGVSKAEAEPNPKTDGKKPPPEPKRILGVMPNYRAVSAGEIPPPPTPKEAFGIATENTFDYSSFVFAGITSLMAEGSDTHPALGHGIEGFGQYYWRGFVDKADGNYLVIFALPTFLHEDERYYAMGEGGFWKRAFYSATRVLITPDYNGRNTVNLAEILGRSMAQAISVTYYPVQDRNLGDISEKFGWAVGRDALTNVFREFWPDINAHVLHRHHKRPADGQ